MKIGPLLMTTGDRKFAFPKASHILTIDVKSVDHATLLAPFEVLSSTSLSTPVLPTLLNESPYIFAEVAVQSIPLTNIDVVYPRLRQLQPNLVAVIASSIQLRGVLQPLIVRQSGRGRYDLVAGHHRLEAVRALDWTLVPCRVMELDDERAELVSIDENLARSELSPAEWTLHVVRRNELHEAVHGSSKARGANAANLSMGHNANAILADAFTMEAARITRRSQRTIQRTIAAGKTLGPDTLVRISGTSLDHPGEIGALSKLLPKERASLVEAAESGKEISAVRRSKDLMKLNVITLSTNEIENTSISESKTIDDQFNSLLGAWERTSQPARDRFLAWLEAGK